MGSRGTGRTGTGHMQNPREPREKTHSKFAGENGLGSQALFTKKLLNYNC